MRLRSSGKRTDIDPTPWSRFPDAHSGPRFADCDTGFLYYNPRPEFNQSFTNPVNPILAAFRQREDSGNIFAVKQWVGFTTRWDGSICEATSGEVRHARRVLTRILNLHTQKAAA